MTQRNRTDSQAMAGAPLMITLAGIERKVELLGFGAALLWMERAGTLEQAMGFQKGDFGEDGKPASPEIALKFMRFLSPVSGLVFDYMGLSEKERDDLDRALAHDMGRSINEIVVAWNQISEVVNPTKAAPTMKPKSGRG